VVVAASRLWAVLWHNHPGRLSAWLTDTPQNGRTPLAAPIAADCSNEVRLSCWPPDGSAQEEASAQRIVWFENELMRSGQMGTARHLGQDRVLSR
jgi:hypothetical protein